MTNYIIAGILIALAICLIRERGIIRLILGIIAGFCGVIFIVDDSPVTTIHNKAKDIKTWILDKTEPAVDSTLAFVEIIKEEVEKPTRRMPKGWFPDNEPTGINDGYVRYYTVEENSRDSILIRRDHSLIGQDDHYFPPEEEFERAKRLYNRSWIFDGEKVYVQDGPFDSIYIIRKNGWWYKQHKDDER